MALLVISQFIGRKVERISLNVDFVTIIVMEINAQSYTTALRDLMPNEVKSFHLSSVYSGYSLMEEKY